MATASRVRGDAPNGSGSDGGVRAAGSHGRLLSQPKLRRLVARLQGCLAALAPQLSQALVLRTGLGLRHSYTREQVARILRLTLKQEGRIELQATDGLTTASAHGGCGNHVSAVPTEVMRAVNVLLGATSPGLATSTNPSIAASPGRQPSRGASRGRGVGARSRVSQQPPASSAAIAPPQASGPNFLLVALALAIALGLTALWLLVGGRSSLPATAVDTPRLGPANVADVKGGALDARRLRHGAAALAGAVGLAALVDGASARRRSARATPPSEPATPDAALAGGIEAFDLGAALAEKGDIAGAEAAFRDADEQGHPSAASNLGVLLEHRGDVAGAEGAYQRADERGDATGAFNLGALLEERNDFAGAEAALRRADERGDAAGAWKLGMLLERRGDLAGADAAYHRADERGDPDGACNVGSLLAEKNDLVGAEAAFRRADNRGHSTAASNLGVLLEHRGDYGGAEAAYRRADQRGDATGAFNLGALLEKRNARSEAEAAYARAIERAQGDEAELARAALSRLRTRG